jgi:hypothetical protein
VSSPTSFEIDQYRVTCNDAVTFQFDNPGPDANFKVENIRVGTELEIRGDFSETTQTLRAKTLKLDLDQFRKMANTAVLDSPPTGLARTGRGWTGTFFADGKRIQLSPETKVLLKLTSEQVRIIASRTGKVEPEIRPLASLEEIAPGMVMTYEGVRDAESGVILADSVEFGWNDFEKGEQDLWTRSVVRFESAGLSDKLGEVTLPGLGKFKLVPNESVQDYLSKVGESLIPKYALSIPVLDPSKFQFQFYIVVDNQPNAFALPTGVFVIHSGMFGVLENEAQLAALIAREIAHVTQKHQWRQIQERKSRQSAGTVTEVASGNAYTPDEENQADRIALEYMVNAGYDPREAPKLWTAIANASGTKSKNFYSSDNRLTRRSYLLSQIKENYSELNFGDFRTEETRFKQMSDMVKQATSGN